MKEKIERVLKPLIGEPLSGMSRLGGMQMFEFGIQRPRKNRKGQDITLADQRLHVSCHWCITGPEGGIFSSEDFHPVRRDEKAYPFYDMLESDPPAVEAIAADEKGGFTLRMVRGYTLVIWLIENTNEPDAEQWRFLPKAKSRNHFVVTQRGIDS